MQKAYPICSDRYRLTTLNHPNPIVIDNKEGVAKIALAHDSTLQVTQEGKLSITPKILLQGELDMRAKAPIQLVLDPDVNPADVIGSEVTLLYDEDDFSINDHGKLKTVLPTWKGMGALKVGGVTDVDFLDNFYDGLSDDDLNVPKLKAIR